MSSQRNEETIIDNFEWERLSLDRLKQVQSKISKVINLKISGLELPGSPANIASEFRYDASLAKIFPNRLRASLSEYKNCVFLISLGTRNAIYSERVEACVKWISERFQTCLVLVGDSVYRLTIEMRHGLKDCEAWMAAFQTGKEFIERHDAIFEKYSQSCCFELKLTSTYAPLPLAEIEEPSELKLYYEGLQNLYQNNEPFQRIVNFFAQTYLNRSKPIDAIGQKHLAITYLMEELALFTYVAKEGWSIFIYPGSIKTFEEISEGLHPGVPEPLKQMIWVSLHLKRDPQDGN